MSNQPIKNIVKNSNFLNQQINVHGWVKTRRDSKSGVSFIDINDGSSINNLQIVAPNTLPNYTNEILKISAGCSISAKGQLVASLGTGQNHELLATEITIIGWVENPETYPIQPKKHSLEYLREVAHLRPRTNIISAITRIRHTTSLSINNYLSNEGFFWIHTPLITSCDCEGAGELFRVSTLDLANLPYLENKKIDFTQDFFGKESYLTVSGQLNLEAYCLALSKVYTFGPTFRAENSNTSRHLSEFWMIEPEVAFAGLDDIAKLATNLIKDVAKNVLDKNEDDLAFLAKFNDINLLERLNTIIQSDFEYMDYSNAIEALIKSNRKFSFPVKWGLDLQTEHERYICEELTNKPTIITNYPKEIKSFYMRLNNDNKTVAAMDILAPGIGEITGGSQREERLDHLDKRMDELKIDKTAYQWYRDLRRYGTVPHAGFGIGLERLLGYLTGVPNVRELIPFPRTPKSINF